MRQTIKTNPFLFLVMALFVSACVNNVEYQQITVELTNFSYSAPQITNANQAFEDMIDANKDIKNMQKSNLTTYFVKNLLFTAQKNFIGLDPKSIMNAAREQTTEEGRQYANELYFAYSKINSEEFVETNYSLTTYYSKYVNFRREQAFYILDTVALLEDKINVYNESKFDVSRAGTALELAKEAFAAERYDEAGEYLIQTEIKLEEARYEKQRLVRLAELSKNFLQKYWIELSLSLILLVIFVRPIVRKIRRHTAAKKVVKMKTELVILQNMLKKAQKDCFVNRKLTEETYKIREIRYKNKIAELKQKIPVYNAIAKGEEVKISEKPEEKRAILKI